MLQQQFNYRILTPASSSSSLTFPNEPQFLRIHSEAVDSKKSGPYTGRDPNAKKPVWLKQKAAQGERFSDVKESLSRLKLHTVCEEAQCSNIGECWNGGGDSISTATIMLLGDTWSPRTPPSPLPLGGNTTHS